MALVSTLVAALASIALADARAATDTSRPPGTIATVAGSNAPGTSTSYGFSGDGGPATSALLYQPRAIAFDADGNAYIADGLNHRIRKIDTAGTITTVAGIGTAGYSGDNGPATEAQMNTPHGVAVDSAGNLYIADSSNHRIRRVDADGVITTVVGTGRAGGTGEGGPASQALIKHPKTMMVDSANNLWFADTGNNRICRVNLDDGLLTTVAGNTRAGFEGDGGPADRALLNTPNSMWVTPDGVLYIADSDNHRIRKVDAGTITTIAGTGQPGSSGDGGPAGGAQLNDPRGLVGDTAGNLYVSEEAGQRIRKIDSSGTITTIAGTGTAGFSGDGGPATEAQVNQIRGLALDSKGNLWAADLSNNRVRVVYGVAAAGSPAPAPGPSPSPSPGPSPSPSPSPSGSPTAPAPGPQRSGYWALGRDGRVYPFGDATSLGEATDRLGGAAAIHLEPTPSFNGYWILDDRGIVSAFGDATALGNLEASRLGGDEKPTSLSATPTGRGYWIFTTKGRAFPFGDAIHHGDMAGVTLNGPVLSSVATPSGRGYYMVASDGGVFSFGDARFYGSMGGKPLNKPVQSLVPDRDGVGYWLVASDGGIFSFEAAFRGSMGGKPLNKPVVGMVRYGTGYLMVAADGGIFNFSDRPFSGSLGSNPPDHPIVAVATLDTTRPAQR